jgi:hypothetical protein
MQDKQKVTLYLPPDIHRQLKIRAAIDVESISGLVERAIDFYLKHTDKVEEVEAAVYGGTHQVHICPEVETAMVMRDGRMVSLKKQPTVVDEDFSTKSFITITRYKETADKYLLENNSQKASFYYHQIIAILDRIQEGKDIFTRRSLVKSYLDVYQRLVALGVYINEFNIAFFYAELSRNRFLVERLTLQDISLPDTLKQKIYRKIEYAKCQERKTLQNYTDGISKKLDKQRLEKLNNQWSKSKCDLENIYRQIAEIEPEFIAKTKVYPIYFEEVQSGSVSLLREGT